MRLTSFCISVSFQQKPASSIRDAGFLLERSCPTALLAAADESWRCWYIFRQVAFFSQSSSLWLQHAARTTILAPILLLASTIRAILDYLLALTHPTSVGYCFLNHPAILLHHLLLYHYPKMFMNVEKN